MGCHVGEAADSLIGLPVVCNSPPTCGVLFLREANMKGSTVVLIAAGVVGYVLYMGAGSDGNVTLGAGGGAVIGLALLAAGVACLMSKDKGLKLMGLCLIALIVTVALGHSPTELGDWLVGR